MWDLENQDVSYTQTVKICSGESNNFLYLSLRFHRESNFHAEDNKKSSHKDGVYFIYFFVFLKVDLIYLYGSHTQK